jgi:hypothetical protein
MDALETGPVAAGGMIGGFVVSRYVRRELGGGVLVLAGGWCVRRWLRDRGPVLAAGLGIGYAAAFGAAHPLAQRIGAWPSALTASASIGAAAYLFADRPGS